MKTSNTPSPQNSNTKDDQAILSLRLEEADSLDDLHTLMTFKVFPCENPKHFKHFKASK